MPTVRITSIALLTTASQARQRSTVQTAYTTCANQETGFVSAHDWITPKHRLHRSGLAW
jgi:hypothetical protein